MIGKQYASNRRRISTTGPFASCIASAVLVIIATLMPAANAAAQSSTVEFNIPAQPVGSALRAYAHQARVQLLVLTEGLEAIQANAVVGHLDPRTALQMLLAGTGLQAEYRPDATVAVQRGPDTSGPVTSASGDARHGHSSLLAQARQEPAEAVMMAQAMPDQNQTSRRKETGSGKDEQKRPLDEIVVTGTSIRGIAPDSSPTRTYTREDILITGAATAQEFIQTLPQNFGGGSNITVMQGFVPNSDHSVRYNDPYYGGAGGASVNLHGLGSGATLVLLNGHRLAPSSGIGDFADISMIPASALERVEILTDGASSIYGGDAVAGVVNFILRDDFDGAETSLRYGTVTEGDLDQYRANFTGGKVWDTGNALVVYEYFSQDDLSAGDRSFSQNALLPTDLLPKQERHSVLASVSQEVTPDLELFGDVLFSERKMALDSTSILGHAHPMSKSDSRSISAGGSWAIDNDWVLDTFGTYSNAQTEAVYESMSASIPRTVDSKLWTVDAKVSGTVLQLTGGGLKLAFGGHYRSAAFSNVLLALRGVGDQPEYQADRDIYAFFAEAYIPIVGPDNAMPGLARLEINASGRFADYSDFGSTADPKVGVLWSPFEGLNLRGSYSTSFNSPPLGRVGAADTAIFVYPITVL